MHFSLIDRITDITPGSSITTVKNLTMAEEYLAEHFPSFPVMPGVMMLETITQSGAWLVRLTERFEHSVILLQEAKTVKFGKFVTPGHQLVVHCELIEDDGKLSVLKAKGTIDGQTSVSAKIRLTRFNLRDKNPVYRRDDQRLRAHHIETFHVLATAEVREKLRTQMPEAAVVG